MGWWFFNEFYDSQKDFVRDKVFPHEYGSDLSKGDLHIQHVSQRSGEVYVAYTFLGVRNIDVFWICKAQGAWGYKHTTIDGGPYAFHCPEKILKWYEEGRESIPELAAQFIARNRQARTDRLAKAARAKCIKALPIGALVCIAGKYDRVFRIESHDSPRLTRGQCELRQVLPYTLRLFHRKYSGLEPCYDHTVLPNLLPLGAKVQVQGLAHHWFVIEEYKLAQGLCVVRQVEPDSQQLFEVQYDRLLMLPDAHTCACGEAA